MGLLSGKKILVTGVITERSIAYGVAKAIAREGGEVALTYQLDKFKDRALEMAKSCNSELVFQCDVSEDQQITSLAKNVQEKWTTLDGFVHSIAYSPKEGVGGDIISNSTREAFQVSQDISAYSLIALAKELVPLIEGRQAGSIVSMTYLGSQRAIPNYNLMGVAKASLESINRYLAASLGKRNIRVNAISPGPIRTTAAAGISGFSKLMQAAAAITPLGRNITIDEVGNVAAFLLSDYASAITGEILYADGGYNIAAGGDEV